MAMDAELKKLTGAAIAVGSMAAIVLTALAVVTGYKNTNQINNATADLFISGLTIFGTFIGVIVIALVGKVIFGLFKSN